MTDMDELRAAAEAMARRFHEAYERLAPEFGYTTREETREFDPSSPNGRLMIAVCAALSPSERQEAAAVRHSCNHPGFNPYEGDTCLGCREAAAAGQGEREAFEAWAINRPWPFNGIPQGVEGNIAWLAWQARASMPALPSQGQETELHCGSCESLCPDCQIDWARFAAPSQPAQGQWAPKQVDPEPFKIGGRYNWKGQPERLVYLGKNWSSNGFWHQFAKVENPTVVWCEVLGSDLQHFEATAPAQGDA